LAVANLPGVKLVLDPCSEARLVESLDDIEGVSDRGIEQQLTLASGPEGGLAPTELSQLVLAGFIPVGLGPRVLRAETAPVAALAIVRAITRS
jgi:RsmE family RNA methyltransferase